MAAVPKQIVPPDEPDRLAAVARYEILDSPPDGAFDRITALAARFLRVPISTISIVDHDRIWFKSKRGVEVEQIERAPGLCASAILQYEPWIVEDAAVDPRTLDNPLVRGELGLRFYAGIPLTTRDGYNLGTLNVIDVVPRAIADEEVETLQDLAAIVLDELELRLAARREEERLDSVRGDFLVTASHELRTPLAAVYGAAKSLSAGRVRDEGGRAQLLRVIDEESERLSQIVERILLAVEVEAGRVTIVRERVDPVWVVERAVEAAAASADAEGRVHVRTGGAADVIESDATKIRHVLANLIENAVKYTSGAVEVLVEARNGGGARFIVRDDGDGVPEEERERVFEKFYRLDPQQAGGVGGTGLGLYVAREYARQLRGTLTAGAREGGGAEFVLELPARL